MSTKPIALITGATSGIGEATARLLAKKYQLILCGRRKERLEKLAGELTTPTHLLSFDVREKEDVFRSIGSIPEAFSEIDLLVNNAGNAHGFDFIHEGDPADWDAMIDINVKGLLYVSKAVIPGMVERKRGHIVNLSSLAGREVYPRGNVYCASKYAVDALTKSMRLDLNPYGIKVTSIDPGLVDTAFSQVRFKGDMDRVDKVYEGFTPLTAEDVAETIEFVVNRPAHVVVGDMLLMPVAQASSTLVNRKET